jgi:hypothetical protein
MALYFAQSNGYKETIFAVSVVLFFFPLSLTSNVLIHIELYNISTRLDFGISLEMCIYNQAVEKYSVLY